MARHAAFGTRLPRRRDIVTVHRDVAINPAQPFVPSGSAALESGRLLTLMLCYCGWDIALRR